MSHEDMNIENIHIEQNDDLIFVTIGKYKMFLACEQLDALNLFMHYMFTARLQKTNSIKANDTYLRNGLGWGIKKIKKAKTFLKKQGLIDYKQDRNSDGTLSDTYIVLHVSGGSNFAPPEPVGSFTAPPVDRPTGDETQMLKQTSKCFNKQGKFIEPQPEIVQEYLNSKGITSFTGQQFCDFYGSKGWMIGKNKMRDWHKAVGTWTRHHQEQTPKKPELFRARDPFWESLSEEEKAVITKQAKEIEYGG